MNKIQLSTRRNILDSFIVTKITWYGSLEQQMFLGRLYDLSTKPSNDHRFTTIGQEIHKHTVLNNDWPDEWVFTDFRFNILHTSDKEFLDFLCLTIHPVTRDNEGEITTLLEIYNNNLKESGFVIENASQVGTKPVFVAREIINQPSLTTKQTLKKSALVIGCSDYEHANKLINPKNDADSMTGILAALGFSVTKILNPSQKELKMAIDDFGDALKSNDVGLFYFAGHGVQIKGFNYLIPVDATLKSEKMIEYDCVEANRILSVMEEAKTKVIIIILDACRNNPFERSWSRGLSERGLAVMNAPKGSLIAYSTSPGRTASDGTGNNGLYTEVLLTKISETNTSINTMFQKVRTDVMSKSKEEQIPWESTSLTSDFYFNKQ